MSELKIFVRERRKVSEGEKTPRYHVAAVSGVDLKIKAKHLRRMEIQQIASELGAKVIFLQAGKEDDEDIEEEE